jgi:AcrR family transcriptional regulator
MTPLRTKKTRAGKGKTTTKESLIEAAEHLFARSGVRKVALQEIGLKAGSANKFAVQYHFGGRDQLIRAVFERRLPQLDSRRAEMLAEANAEGLSHDITTLLEIVFRPIAEIVDSSKRHTYAAFLLGLYEIEPEIEARIRSVDLAPLSKYVVELLRQALPQLPAPLFNQRLRSASKMFMDLLVRIDEKKIPFSESEIIREGLSVVVAMMMAPVTIAARVKRAS